MTRAKQAEDPDFDWPEPLVLDIVAERYPDIGSWTERLILARLQAHALHELYADRGRQAAAARLELLAFCAARGIGPERIDRIDRAVFLELAQLATTRFRTSPRTAAAVLGRIEATLNRLAPEPRRRPQAAPIRPARAAAFHAAATG